jgi:hypothetical protein
MLTEMRFCGSTLEVSTIATGAHLDPLFLERTGELTDLNVSVSKNDLHGIIFENLRHPATFLIAFAY